MRRFLANSRRGFYESMEITKKVHLNACGALKFKAISRSLGGLTTKIHMVIASDRAALTFSLSGGEKK